MRTVLDAPPRLGALYAKAALGAVGRRGSALPGTELARADVAVDRDHLAGYARVCGFAVGDALPPAYPHVLAFPLQVALMADRAFPLPLPGLVHVRNAITVHRRIDAAERLDVRVRAERFVAHPKGAQVDLVAAVAVDGEPVWDGRSTYLARGATAPEGSGEPAAEPAAVPEGAPTATWRVDAGTGRRYARVSGDVNPIHLHPLTARAFGFPRAIAHGMWTAARSLAALQGRLPDALGYDVAFGRPLLLPSTVELRTRSADDGWDLDVRSRKRTHLTGAIRPAAG
ncbi:MaoC/PaaZ C-terminal domain-containing protein [Pseudonocardia nigra]|uniref:MaoC/PaaZ C-terminal domain-containing protein n=1 Tax=Pseudonocardia nigra TaxID=1921578 RepID=UPI001C5F53E8|nr:MaoC/PaaZ C-terminal domain-containing protein [Pseudonocardia nigra]